MFMVRLLLNNLYNSNANYENKLQLGFAMQVVLTCLKSIEVFISLSLHYFTCTCSQKKLSFCNCAYFSATHGMVIALKTLVATTGRIQITRNFVYQRMLKHIKWCKTNVARAKLEFSFVVPKISFWNLAPLRNCLVAPLDATMAMLRKIQMKRNHI